MFLHRVHLRAPSGSAAPRRARICASLASADTGVRLSRAEAEALSFRSSSSRSGCTYKIVAVPNVSHVINYDFPAGTDAVEDYVHRIGRTGRGNNVVSQGI